MRIFLLCSFINCILIFPCKAQIGINTNTPIGAFHIDGGAVGSTTDDVIVDNLGKMGIATTSPTNQLHIKATIAIPSLAIRDGSQQGGKMLTSDTQGIGSWKFAGYQVVQGVLSPTGRTYLVTQLALDPAYTILQTSAPLYPLDGTLTLPPGRWCVYTNFLLNTSGNNASDTFASNTWIRLTYSGTYGGATSTDIIGAPWTSGPVYAISYGVIQGFIVILNNSSTNKTYHLGAVFADQGLVSTGVQINNLASRNNGENVILAVKIANN